MGFRTSRLWFPSIPLSCHPNYRALTFTLAGLSPAEHTSLSWLQPPHQLISGRGKPRVPRSLLQQCEGTRGSKGGGWDHSISRRLSAILNTDHTSPTLELESVRVHFV